ncbi:MAG TPA: transglutaminase-like cysteine peptidase [Xanthobacteraceae bacterium]
MTPRRTLRKLGSSRLTAALALSIFAYAGSLHAVAADETANDGTAEFMPGSERGSARPPATFFSINAVLAKLDRQRGRGPDAIRLASLTPANVATDAPTFTKEAPPIGKEPFGLFTFRAPDGMLWRKWRGIESDMAREQSVMERCRGDAEGCPSHAAQFLRLINAVKAKSGRAMLDEANRAVNMAIRYVSDYAQHGEADRWSAPLATFATAKGDCEDYAIAKYVALREAGFPHEQLRLVLVRDRSVRQDHAVLAARLDDHWLILDNRHSQLIDDQDASNFTPLFAINHDGVHLFAAPYARRALPDDQSAAKPAASGDAGLVEWTGSEPSAAGFTGSAGLPLLI